MEAVEHTPHADLLHERSPLPHWLVGLDWGDQTHQIDVLDRPCRWVGARAVPPNGVSLAQWVGWLPELADGKPGQVAGAIATPRGAIVETLREQGFKVCALNPQQLDRVRDRHSMAGATEDRREAFGLADALRSDPPRCRPGHRRAPALLGLRALSRAEERLGQELGRTAHRLRDQRHRFSPQRLPLCPSADAPWLWALLDLAPPPAHALLLREEQGRRVLKAHRMRRLQAADVLVCLQAPALHVAPGAAEAAQAHGGWLLPCLRVLAEHLRACAQQVRALLSRLTEEPAAAGPSDVAIVLSLPGVGRTITAWFCAEAAQPLAERASAVLRTPGGVAPVTRHSGQRRQGGMRRACTRH